MEKKDYYASLVQLVMQSETITWNRFNNFLVSSSILIVAWAAVYFGKDFTSKTIVLIALSLMGFLAGILSALLGHRGRQYLNLYFSQAHYCEEKDDEPLYIKPFFIANDQIRRRPESKIRKLVYYISSSHFLIVTGSLAYSAIFYILYYQSWQLL